ncbi:mechanosensitive ion channel domain-containing protein [Leucothrix arctica]|uniref:Small-conductance mechanosensitive channel n=1 Tax=Leucothrix arctica TaxID=1481894 RepID=A0A317CIJ8_9GAMM|nr:mechanosensitive ion channel domain-containing protein [Leucothrix arctica]PWQ98385.1 mechanosensitive ion channel protein MscS [Leucothrix arctica]
MTKPLSLLFLAIFFQLSLAIFLSFASITSVQADTITDLLGGASTADTTPADNKVITTDSSSQSDRKIRVRLQEIYTELDNLNALSVSVNKSVVTIRGEVTTAAEELKAVTLAKQIEGVVEVENELVITRSVEKRLETTWNKVATLSKDIANALPVILIALVVFIVFWILGGWLSNRQGVFRRITPNHFIANLLGQITHLILIIIGLVLALSLLDATGLLGTIMGAAGIFGLAIGFAVRDTVENYIASILLSLRNPFQVHDFVEISGKLGSVARLTTRATILIAPDGNHVRIPNAEVFKAIIINYTRNPERRFHFDLGIDVAQDLSEAQQLAVDTLHNMEGVLDDPKPMALVDSLGDFSVIVRVYGWVNQEQFSFSKVNSEAIKQTKQAFDDAGIVMPEPIYQIRVTDNPVLSADAVTTVSEPSKPVKEEIAKHRVEQEADLTPDDTAMDQIQEESENSDNENLLSPQAPTE